MYRLPSDAAPLQCEGGTGDVRCCWVKLEGDGGWWAAREADTL